ncbi:MAG: PilZ domain-containing protein [Spirochaetaceae bacterium]|nr:PilZ domain-containing protein [Spirochaetaceae bacterium]
MFPLQSLSMFSIGPYEASPWHIGSFIGGVAIIAGILTFLNLSKKVQRSKLFNSSEIEIKRNSPEEDVFLKKTAELRLTKDELRFLKEVLQSGRADLSVILDNKKQLDEIFKARYKELMKESAYSDAPLNQLTKLFAIRNTIAYFKEIDKADSNYSHRQYIRKESNIPCECCLVGEVKTTQGKKIIKKLVLTNKTFKGAVLGISAGGCSVSCDDAVRVGGKIKIDFTVSGRKASVLSEALRVNKKSNKSVVSLRFLKVLPKSLCAINAFIFDYS